jgi:hypothetical protein
MSQNPEQFNADQARAPLPRLTRASFSPNAAEDADSLEEPVREELDESPRIKPALPVARRPVPVTPKVDAGARDPRPASPPSLARRPIEPAPRTTGQRYQPTPPVGPLATPRPELRSAGVSPVVHPERNERGEVKPPAVSGAPRMENKPIAPVPVSLPAGIQRGFPRPQPGSNGVRPNPAPAPRPISPMPGLSRPEPERVAVEDETERAAGPAYPPSLAPVPAVPIDSPKESAAAAVVQPAPPVALPPARPSFLEEVLDRLANPPAKTALLGICDDQLPVLIDLNDPAPGALLAVSDDDLLRQRLLRTLVQTSAALNSPRSVQFIIFSANPAEWQEWVESQEIMRHCLSIERLTPAGEEAPLAGSPERWLLKLSSWADQRRSGGTSGPAVVLIVDDLQAAAAMEYDARVNFDWLLKEGPAVSIWPVAGLRAARAKEMTRWVRLFKTRILGPAEDAGVLKQFSAGAEVQVEPAQFAVRVQDSWLKFRLPILPSEVY